MTGSKFDVFFLLTSGEELAEEDSEAESVAVLRAFGRQAVVVLGGGELDGLIVSSAEVPPITTAR
jgi:hypothetical protein